jgi:hypothetical protein
MKFFHKLKSKKSKKIILSIFLIIAICLIFIPRGFAQAGMGTWIGSFFISIIALVLYLCAVVTTFLMQIGGSVLAFVMTTSFNDGLFLDAPFVKIAWGFCRDLANLFFILWLVIIALSIMLNVKDYGSKKLLTRLIIVALLVNFSLVLCGFILDIAQGAMGFLTQSVVIIDGSPYSLAEGLSMSFKQSELFGARLPNMGNFFGGNFDASVGAVMHNFLVVIFGAVAAYVFILLAVMLLVRVAALWLLLIFAPLAWVIGIMPFARKAFSEWMKQFWSWAFYGVIVSFYIYLAAMAVWAIDQSAGWSDRFEAGNKTFGAGMGTGVSFLENFTSILSFMVVIILLLLAKSQAFKGSKAGAMVVGAVGGYIMGKVGKKGLGGWAQRKTVGVAKEKAGQAKEWSRGKAGGLLMRGKNIPGLGGVVARKGGKMKAESIKTKEERVSKAFDYSGLSEKEQLALSSKLKGVELEKMTREMIKNDTIQKLDKSDPEQYKALQRMYKMAQKPGNEKMLKDFERKRFDVITDPSSYALNKREMVEVAASNDPLLKQKIQQQKQQKAEAKSKKVLEEAVKKGEFKNEDFVNNLSTGQLTEVLKNKDAAKAISKAAEDWTQNVKNSVLEKVQAGFTDEFRNKDDHGRTIVAGENNIKMRNFYAKMSGNYHKAFDVNTADWNPQLIENREKIIKESVGKIRGEKEWQKLNDSDENIEAVARHIESSQLGNAGRYLDSNTKDKIYDKLGDSIMAEPTNTRYKETYENMMSNDLWPGAWDKKEFESKRKERKKQEAEQTKQNQADEQRQRDRRIKARRLRRERKKTEGGEEKQKVEE